MSNRSSLEGEYRVEGSVLDELGLDRQAALEPKLKAALHHKILHLVKAHTSAAEAGFLFLGLLRPE